MSQSPVPRSSTDSATSGGKPTRTLLRGLAVLELLAAESASRGMGPSLIAEGVGLDKATTMRLLSTLREAGYVAQDPDTRAYQLTSKVLQLARGFGADDDVRDVVRRHLTRLRDNCGESVHYGVVEGHEVVYVEKLESSRSIRLVSAIGQRMPLSTTSLGKAILSALPEDQRDELMAELELVRRTQRSITDPDAFRDELARCTARGYAIDDAENEDGVTCLGAALSASGQVAGAISISGPSFRIEPALEELGARCRETAKAISTELSRAAGMP